MFGLLIEAIPGRSIYAMREELRSWNLEEQRRIVSTCPPAMFLRFYTDLSDSHPGSLPQAR